MGIASVSLARPSHPNQTPPPTPCPPRSLTLPPLTWCRRLRAPPPSTSPHLTSPSTANNTHPLHPTSDTSPAPFKQPTATANIFNPPCGHLHPPPLGATIAHSLWPHPRLPPKRVSRTSCIPLQLQLPSDKRFNVASTCQDQGRVKGQYRHPSIHPLHTS